MGRTIREMVGDTYFDQYVTPDSVTHSQIIESSATSLFELLSKRPEVFGLFRSKLSNEFFCLEFLRHYRNTGIQLEFFKNGKYKRGQIVSFDPVGETAVVYVHTKSGYETLCIDKTDLINWPCVFDTLL